MFTSAGPKYGWLAPGRISWSVIEEQSPRFAIEPAWMPSDSCHTSSLPSGENDG
jgi:hypothetical protein